MEDIINTHDGSKTLYSKKYNQHYHNIEEGALHEALNKHVIHGIEFFKDKKEINILDICFGIGYNSLATLYYIKRQNLDLKVNIYSPELLESLIDSLKDFDYPEEFAELKSIIKELSLNKRYEDEQIKINLYIGDARKYVKNFKDDFFHLIYQDAFSSDVNVELWTKEYFDEIFRISKKDVMITTYSVATPIRLSMHEAGFLIYEYAPIKRKLTFAYKHKQEVYGKFIDMDLKKQRNPLAKAIYDS